MFAHATFRLYTADPNEIQPVGAYSGFQYTIHPKPVKSKAYFHLTFPASPDKSTVHQVMVTCKDQPVFTLITELKNEKKEHF